MDSANINQRADLGGPATLRDAGVDNYQRPLRLCRIVTVPITFTTLLRRQLKVIIDNNIDVTLVSGSGEELEPICRQYSMPCFHVPMSRAITPFADIRALAELVSFFRSTRFDIVHSSTPKAGLLTAIAGWLARVPTRMHTFTGQPWVEMRGLPRLLARSSDKVIGALATDCYADSESQREFLIREGIVRALKIAVLASGSISGVDLERFDPSVWRDTKSATTRGKLKISPDALVVLFVGRITRQKGIVELVSAFRSLNVSGKDVHLVLVGPFEPEHDPLPPTTLEELSNHPRIHVVGFTPQPEVYMGIADVFCLPSYREGFGSVVIEAAAMGVPSVATNIVGLADAVVPDETGLLVPPKDSESLHRALDRILSDPELRNRLGISARVRARQLFNATIVNQVVAEEYWRRYSQGPLGHLA